MHMIKKKCEHYGRGQNEKKKVSTPILPQNAVNSFCETRLNLFNGASLFSNRCIHLLLWDKGLRSWKHDGCSFFLEMWVSFPYIPMWIRAHKQTHIHTNTHTHIH